MSVVVTNARNRVAYNVVRSLGRRGVKVYTADSVPSSMSFSSRHAAGHFLYPSPFRDPEGFIEELLAQVVRTNAEVLIPVFEETFLIAKHRELLAPHVRMAIPDYSQILIAHNKDRWEIVARELGISVPATYSLDNAEDRSAATVRARYPALIKPKQGGGAWGIREFAGSVDLERALQRDNWGGRPWDRFFLQEKILGDTHCVAMLFSGGAQRASVAYKQLRDYPVTGGQATLRVSLRSDHAESALRRLLERLKWHGPCQADFIVEQSTGEPYLIDINPRLWGSLTQAIASGVDFPYLIYQLAREGDVAPVISFQTGVVTRWLGGDLAALPARLRRSHHRFAVLRDFLFPSVPAAIYDDFSISDPLPFVAWSGDALLRAFKFRSLDAVSHDSLDGIWE